MTRFVLALAYSLSVMFCSAQNLVPNPSFEEYLECPFSTAELNNQVMDWYSWQESPDFFHTCSIDLDGFAGVPENAWGYQVPITGDGYAGLFTFADYIENVREYIATPLMSALVTGESYYLMVHVSRCDSSEADTRICATNNIGMRFFKDPSYSNFPPDQAFVADNFAHLNYQELITDDQNWTLVEGWFTADENYNWLAIGNFFTDDQTEIEVLNDEGSCSGIYYIENVCVALDPAECDYLQSTGAERPKSSSGIYPNPASDFVRISPPNEGVFDVAIYDLNGRLVKELSNIQADYAIDVSMFQKGVYVVRVSSNHYFITIKLIIS